MSIWEHKTIKKALENIINSPAELITLDEGNTPFQGIEPYLYFKREDLNPTGSWKDRGTAFKLTQLLNSGIHEAVISSSGNAAISFMQYANSINDFKMNIVVSPNVAQNKKEILESNKNDVHEVIYDENARRRSAQISAEKAIPLLRASGDNDIIKGYWSLGVELYKQIKRDLNSEIYIYAAVSSGTAVQGMVEGLYQGIEDESKMPHIIMCQTQSCHPLQPEVAINDERSLAEAITDQKLFRRPQLEKILDKTNGEALTISNNALENAHSKLKDLNPSVQAELTYNSLLPYAGYLLHKNRTENSISIVITSGR